MIDDRQHFFFVRLHDHMVRAQHLSFISSTILAADALSMCIQQLAVEYSV